MICGTCLLNIIRGCLFVCFSFIAFDCCPYKNKELKFRSLGKLWLEWYSPSARLVKGLCISLTWTRRRQWEKVYSEFSLKKDSLCWVECHSSIHLYSQILLQSFVLCSFLKLVLKKNWKIKMENKGKIHSWTCLYCPFSHLDRIWVMIITPGFFFFFVLLSQCNY